MKKWKCFFILVLIIFLTGCSSYDMTMDISKDKSMDFSVTILSNTEDEIVNNIALYEERLGKYGYSVSKYDKDNKLGMVISKHFNNIDDIALGKRSEEFDLLYFYKNNFNNEIESKIFNVDKGFDTNRYAANFYVDLTDLNIDLDNASVTFKVFVPNGTESNNANLVSSDGNELTWNITSLGKTEIDFVFELKSYDYIYYGGAVLIAILLFFLIINALFSKSGDNNTTNQVNDKAELERKIQNISRNNSVNNQNINNYNNGNNRNNYERNNTVVNYNFDRSNSYRENYNSNNSDGYLDMDRNINSKQNDNLFNSNTFNNNNNNFNKPSNNVNSLVPEIEISNLKTPIKEDKKGLLGKLNKKVNKKTNKEIVPDIKNEDNFSAMVDSINHGQMGGFSVNINSQVTPIQNVGYDEDKEMNNNNFNDNSLNNDIFNFPVHDNNINNDEKNIEENINVKNNPNLNVNAIPSNISSIDSIVYQEQETYNAVEEENHIDDKFDGPVIKVNSKEIVVDKGKKEE